jgi:hypothetical protein
MAERRTLVYETDADLLQALDEADWDVITVGYPTADGGTATLMVLFICPYCFATVPPSRTDPSQPDKDPHITYHREILNKIRWPG